MTNTLDRYAGRVYMAYNASYVVIVDPVDGNGYYIDRTGTSLATIDDADFPRATSLTYQDTFFVVTEHATGRIWKSSSGDPTTWDGLDYATAEGAPDYALIVDSLLRELWIYGVTTTEVFYNSGDTDFPFERIPGSFNDKGIYCAASLGRADNHSFFLGHDLSVYMTEGLQLSRISPPQIDYQIAEMTKKDDAYGFGYTQEGASFYVLTFPTDKKTLVFDLSTQVWHTRASGNMDTLHPVSCATWFDGKVLAGHYMKNQLLYYDYEKYSDDGETLRRVRRAKVIDLERRLIKHHILEIEFEAGVGLVAGQGSDPQVMLRWSDDGGKTWSNEHWRSLGKLGKYKNRARWTKLGQSRERIYEVAVSDPVKVVIIAAYLDATIGLH